jgi:hypothetical protein
MMPVALALIWLELKVLSHLLVEAEPQASPVFGLGLGLAPAPASAGRKKNNRVKV